MIKNLNVFAIFSQQRLE